MQDDIVKVDGETGNFNKETRQGCQIKILKISHLTKNITTINSFFFKHLKLRQFCGDDMAPICEWESMIKP